MQVVKRNGSKEDVQFDKVHERIKLCAYRDGKPLSVNPALIAQKTLQRIYDGVKTSELDELAAQLSVSLITTHPDYETLASNIIISNHQKNTNPSFADTMRLLANQRHVKTGSPMSYLSDEFMAAVEAHGPALDAALRHERDFLLDYFGFKTLERQKYLLRDSSGQVLERPQHLWMRVAVTLWGSSAAPGHGRGAPDHGRGNMTTLDRVLETYTLLSTKQLIHATPTLFNAGAPRAQMSSCYLLQMASDSITGIYKTLSDCAQISKYAGGIGLHIHNVRARGAYIAGNGGTSTGIVPMLRNFNATARYVDQGSKRNGSFAIYLEPWHADVEDFLKLKLPTGSEEERARDLFYALWIPDLFMERVEADKPWTLFCPSEAPGLADVWGPAFQDLYERYEREGRGRKQVEARKLWTRILDSQIETGTPYLLYKDAANSKSNQQNLGTIKSSNLCVAPETILMTRDGPFSICALENWDVSVWNGYRWSLTRVQKTGEKQPLLTVEVQDTKVHTTHGRHVILTNSLECTPYHKFILPSSGDLANAPRVEAQELVPGMQLTSWVGPDGWSHTVRVLSVTNRGRISDTFCFSEIENHAGVFNGILTGNCTEIIEYSDEKETAVCNLASIALPAFVAHRSFQFDALRKVVAVAVRNLNRVIDLNFYPVPETRASNLRHRPIGIGVQGLADVFAMMRFAWDSDKAADLQQRIFEHMYYAAVETSATLAEEEGPYETFAGSPVSKGLLQYDLWASVVPLTQQDGTLDWAALKARASRGIRNSLLMAPMPTASTSQILGYNECFEPVTSNIYTRRTLSGEYIVMNKHLIRDLIRLDIWNDDMKNQIILRNGSIQGIPGVPEATQNLYKTAWEIKQRTLIDMAAARGAFLCQSQSLNLFMAEPTESKLSSMHFYGWKKGLKTGLYYLRTKAPVMAQKFTVDPDLQKSAEESQKARQETEYKADEGCVMCSS